MVVKNVLSSLGLVRLKVIWPVRALSTLTVEEGVDWFSIRGGRLLCDFGGGGGELVTHSCTCMHKMSYTNRRNVGWTSADRSTKATLMLTVPSSLFKSSTKDLTRPTFIIRFHRTCPFKRQCRYFMVLTRRLSLHTKHRSRWISSLSSMDSDLEAFSHNPTDDSFAALAVQPTALPIIWTNGSSRTKLDYCRDNQLISRVKLTCLTTV